MGDGSPLCQMARRCRGRVIMTYRTRQRNSSSGKFSAEASQMPTQSNSIPLTMLAGLALSVYAGCSVAAFYLFLSSGEKIVPEPENEELN